MKWLLLFSCIYRFLVDPTCPTKSIFKVRNIVKTKAQWKQLVLLTTVQYFEKVSFCIAYASLLACPICQKTPNDSQRELHEDRAI